MNKKIVFVLVLVVIIAFLVFSLGHYFNQNSDEGLFQKVEVGGIEFNIPKEYQSLNYSSDIIGESISNGVKTNIDAKSFSNSNEDIIFIFVTNYNDTDYANRSFSNLSGTFDTIKNHDGILSQNENSTKFAYLQGNNLIVVDATNKTLINDIIS